jgi:hypothetical protein
LNSQLELDKLLDTIMQSAKQVAKADACSLLLLDSKTGDPNIQIALSSVGGKLKEVGKTHQIKNWSGNSGNCRPNRGNYPNKRRLPTSKF